MPYKLSATLLRHSSDVRGVASPTNDLVLSVSRDTKAVVWNRSSTDGKDFNPDHTLQAGSRYVNSVAYIQPTDDAPKGYIVTGGQDTVINIFNLANPRNDPDYSLLGHSENVSKVWKNFSLAYDLKGHEYSVWAVLALDEDQYLTGSADKTIRLWKQHKSVQTFRGHQDAVRGLAVVPDLGFASCSNDSEVRVWTLGGDLIYSLSGHTSFVYSLSVLPNGNIVSSGEDRTVRVWEGDECVQTIVHPAISVWSVSSMPNGDIVTGASDGVVRVFSAVDGRWASEADLKEYDGQVASQALPAQQIGDVKKSDLPGPEALSTPGRKAGEVKMIKRGDVVEAHQWDNASSSWQKIGDVVDAVGQGRKQLYQGKEYDYVFDVDIQDGVPPLKLPYNVTENPYAAAQRFLQNNELEMTYIDQVVKFIETNTAGVNLGSGNDEYRDPFTGASRYRSNDSSAQNAPATEYMDPFTGASRYRAQPGPPVAPAPNSNLSDPFTGASRYSGPPAPAPVSSPPSQKILPVSKLFNFKQANISAMQAKLSEFNGALQHEISTSSLAMYPTEVSSFDDIFAHLKPLTESPPRQPSNPLTPTHIEHVISVLERWPASQRFPVIDLGRLLLGFSPGVFSTSQVKEKFIEALFKASEWDVPWTSPLPKARETNILLLFRSLANAFQEGTKLDNTWLVKLFESLGHAPYTLLNKNQRVLSSETTDSEAAYRTLVAIGNIAHVSKQSGSVLGGAEAGQLKQLLRTVASTFPEDRVRAISAEIFVLLV
ncbi:hypothetical protein H1R20_g9510, partial [Candolleomyces eurysporus]